MPVSADAAAILFAVKPRGLFGTGYRRLLSCVSNA